MQTKATAIALATMLGAHPVAVEQVRQGESHVRIHVGSLPVELNDGVNTVEFACAPYDGGSQYGPWTKLWVDATSIEPFQVVIADHDPSPVIPAGTDYGDLVTATSPHGGAAPEPFTERLELGVMAAGGRMLFLLPGTTVTYDDPNAPAWAYCTVDAVVLVKDLARPPRP